MCYLGAPERAPHGPDPHPGIVVSGVCRLEYDVQNFDAHILFILALVYLLSNAATHTSTPTLLLQSLVH